MKKQLILTLIIFLACSFIVAAEDHILISQVLYDPINSETYGEAIELFNPSNLAVNISGYIIKTSSSDHDATLPKNTFIPANSYFLLTDTNFDQYKDNGKVFIWVKD